MTNPLDWEIKSVVFYNFCTHFPNAKALEHDIHFGDTAQMLVDISTDKLVPTMTDSHNCSDSEWTSEWTLLSLPIHLILLQYSRRCEIGSATIQWLLPNSFREIFSIKPWRILILISQVVNRVFRKVCTRINYLIL